MSRFESGNRTNTAGSSATTRRENSPAHSATSSAPGPVYSTRSASYTQTPALVGTSTSRSGTTTPTYASKQSTQAVGRTQPIEAINKLYTTASPENPYVTASQEAPPVTASREALSAPTSVPSSSRSAESGDPRRLSAGYGVPNTGSGITLAAKTDDRSTHAGRGRPTKTPDTVDAAASRESSPAPSDDSNSEFTDDEDPDQPPANDGQENDPPTFASHASGDPTATEIVEQFIQPLVRDQHIEVTIAPVASTSRDNSPSLSVGSSATVSLNSEDSSRSFANDTQSKDAHSLTTRGIPPAETTAVIQQPLASPGRDQLPNISEEPEPPSTMEVEALPILWEDTPEDEEEAVLNSGDAPYSSGSHVPLREPLSLTDLGSGGPAATEAVKYLVQAVGRDVVTFRRNTQVSFMAVERARDIVNAINEYIAKVENSATGDWDSFERFTNAIEPLEEQVPILFTLLAFTEDEKARYFANTGSVEECVSSAENWASNRKELSKALDGFDSRQELVELFDDPNTDSRKREHREAQIYDDLTLLGEMRTTVQTLISEDPDKFPPHVQEVETSLNMLQAKVINGSSPDWLTVITIQTSMVVEGVIEMVESASLGNDILNHLKSKHVWKVALELIEVLEGIDVGLPSLPQIAQGKYDTFIETLKRLGKLALPGSYVGLMKQAGHIRRPFQAQAFALVMLCRFLADRFNAIGDSTVAVENYDALEEAFGKTLDALQAATKAVFELKTFDLRNFSTNDTVEEFGEAETLIRDCFKSLHLDAEWTQRQSELTAAFNKDKERMAKLNNMLSRPQSLSTKSAKVRVNVSIHEESPDGKELAITSVEEVTAMRLLALRWSIAGVLKPEDTKRARTAGTFFKQTGAEWSEILASHSTLAEIVDDKLEVDLKLVIP
ncbi:hypothetical protein F5148DRAFT_1283811 [Russula earlei]|uniref:Uncharacterized protein n=1 Tax=Russula earlei TaxID=71964 RepID=A0ACC0UA99_9AGAM|nr:hypothetical protein F5148DRAFT_1283811 [Russula earlei]